MRRETQGTCHLAVVMLFFRPWSLIFARLTTSLSRHRGVSVFNGAGAASPQATDLEPEETQGEGRSKKVGNRVVFTRMCKDAGRTGSIQLGQVSFWRRGGGTEKEGLQRQWRRITHWMGNMQRRNGKGRQGKARESKARQGKGRQGKARVGKARQGKGSEGKARQGKARVGKAKEGKARHGKARQGKARHGIELF